jgi:membrane fusion protein, copper/silver efflux system
MSPEGEIFLTGKVKADERQLASITAKFPGRIEQLYVNFTGQAVKRGERLVTLYSPELLTAQKELLEAASTKTSFPELYTAAREKLRLWKLTEKQIDAIENTGTVREQFDVLADKGGVVIQRNISVGDYVSTGSILFEVVDLSKVWIMLDAYETDLPFIKTANEISFTTPALPGKTFTAEVTYIDPVINAGTRTASVRAEAGNQEGALKPEMFVNARISTSRQVEKSSLAIPRTALLWTGKRSIVYVKVPDTEFPAYELREITIGPLMDEMYVVEAGLEAGEEVVTHGVFAVDASAQLSGNYSMMSRPRSKTLEVPQAFREQMTALANAYFEVKNALVNSEAVAAKTASNNLETTLSEVDMHLLKGTAHDQWMVLQQQLSDHLSMMDKADNLETLRQHFSGLSDSMVEITETFGLEKEKVYKDFCPMVFGNEGAYWLSETEEIRNPYFGEAMLNCGEIKETYSKNQRVFEPKKPSTPSY